MLSHTKELGYRAAAIYRRMEPAREDWCHAEEMHYAIGCQGAGFAGGVNQEAEGNIKQGAACAGVAEGGRRWAVLDGCRTKTVENIRERFVTEGFEVTLNGPE